MIDKTPPELSLTLGEKTKTSIEVSLSAQDASGIATYRYDYKETNGEWHEGDEFKKICLYRINRRYKI